MSITLAEAFRTGNGRKTKWNGHMVHAVMQLPVQEGDVIEVGRVSASATRAQAVKVAVDKGDLRANGVLMSTAAIWTHTSPESVVLEVTGRKAKSIDIWNSWSFDSVDSAWLGAAGMLVESDGRTYTLRCSDGLGEPTFDDLVVTVKVTSRAS